MPRYIGCVAQDSVVLVVDVQDKLLAAIPRRSEAVRNIGFLLDVAAVMGVPVQATEQYPKGLGSTTSDVARRLLTSPLAKTSFSCCEADGFLDGLKALRRESVVLVGMETHVCVAQTAFDLLSKASFRVFVPVDAVASRFDIDHDVALRAIEGYGAELTTVEAVAFEWVRDAADPRFKAVSKLVVGRSANPHTDR